MLLIKEIITNISFYCSWLDCGVLPFHQMQLLILLTADPSSQRPWCLFQLLPSVLDFCSMLPFHKWSLCFQPCNSNPFSYGSFLSWWVARSWPARFWWRSTWVWFLSKWRSLGFCFKWLFPLLQPVVHLLFEGTHFHLVCQTKLHLLLGWLYLLSTDDITHEPQISSWIGHQTDKVLLSLYSYSEMNTALHLLHLTSVASRNEVYLFLLECSFYTPFLSLFVYAVFVSHTALFLFDHG